MTWLEAALLPASSPGTAVRLAYYALTSANDAPERDPCDFMLEGLETRPSPVASAAAGKSDPAAAAAAPSGDLASPSAAATEAVRWQVLDAQQGVQFGCPGQRLEFEVSRRSVRARYYFVTLD